jgi:hypothetical protein
LCWLGPAAPPYMIMMVIHNIRSYGTFVRYNVVVHYMYVRGFQSLATYVCHGTGHDCHCANGQCA